MTSPRKLAAAAQSQLDDGPAVREGPPSETGDVPPPKNIHEAMVRIMAQVKAVAKTGVNREQNYRFRSWEGVYDACRDIMAANGVYPTHRIDSHEFRTRTAKSGKEFIHVTALVTMIFRHEGGTEVETQVLSEAQDFADKSANKLMSMCTKYALIDTFLIPTQEKRDTENGGIEAGTKPADKQQTEVIAGLFKKMGITEPAAKAEVVREVTGKNWHEMDHADAEKLSKELVKRIGQRNTNPKAGTR